MAGHWFTNPRRRVVITGLGVVSPCGLGREAFWRSLVAGHSGIDWIRDFDTSSLYCKIAGQVRNFDPRDYTESKAGLRAGRFSQFGLAAASLAVRDAQLDLAKVDPYRMGAVFGTSLAGNGNIADRIYPLFQERGVQDIDFDAGVQVAAHAVTSHVFIELGMRGPNTTSAAGCCGSLDAVSTAAALLRSGQADVMVAGGTEACVSPIGMALLCKLRVLTRRNDPPQAASRPYDNSRDGLVLSEGAGAVVLETAAHALDRGAHIYAEFLSYASTTEGRDLVVPHPSGEELAQAFRRALLAGRVGPEEIDYVCAHGIANRDYDIAETNAVKMVLGPRAYHVPMSSIKSVTGQPFAAGGSWQLVAACMAIAEGIVPPTINYQVPDPECDLDYVPNQARRARVDTVMLNSHSFGGTHGCLLVRRFCE